jgi:hypothetical protein
MLSFFIKVQVLAVSTPPIRELRGPRPLRREWNSRSAVSALPHSETCNRPNSAAFSSNNEPEKVSRNCPNIPPLESLKSKTCCRWVKFSRFRASVIRWALLFKDSIGGTEGPVRLSDSTPIEHGRTNQKQTPPACARGLARAFNP